MTTTSQDYGRPLTTHDVMDCPTCWVGLSAERTGLFAAPDRDAYRGMHTHGVQPATCPTCSVTSVEWALALEIDALVTELVGASRLSAAIDALG
ncbi:MAG: hypothetical protein IPI32_00675 [Austwickia sp.]|nr:hypothetical protein [Austwickia sp.]MBK8437474.1 hypothetical protein [Austwickia sp.]MBK9102739.1 hypothetical protein [Austwickia sp.]